MKILYIGEYSKNNITTSPIEVAKYLFNESINNNLDAIFICNYSNKYSIKKRIFGKKKEDDKVFCLGIVNAFLLLIKFRPNIVHFVNFTSFGIPFIFFKYILGYRTIFNVHGIVSYELEYFRTNKYLNNKKLKIVEYIYMKLIDDIFVLSKLSSRMITYIYKINPLKLFVIDNGIEHFSIVHKPEYLLKKKIVEVVCVGGLDREEKGYKFLFKALNLIDKKFIVNICSNQYFDFDKTEISANVEVRIIEPLNKIDFRNFIASKDIFIASSIYESFHIALLEAMNTGIPFLSSDRVGLTERFDESLLNNCYRYNNIFEFGEKLESILSRKEEEHIDMSKRMICFSNSFTWDKVYNKYLNVYNYTV